jgi:hypothetical protein
MIGVGAFLVGRMIATGGVAVTGNRWFDGLFALFFVLRGVMNVQAARRIARMRP